MGMTAPNVLDLDNLFQSNDLYSDDLIDIHPSLSEIDWLNTVTPDMYWNFDSGAHSIDLMLDQYNFEPMSTPDINFLGEEWESSLKIDDLLSEEKPLLSHFDILKDNNQPTIIIMPEPQTSNDTNFDVVHTQTTILGVEDISKLQLFQSPEHNPAVNDLPTNLDLCSFINDDTIPIEPNEDKKAPVVPKVKAGRKKIDMKAQRYIVENDNEEEDIDVETVSEGGNNPVLEAGDVNSLLEQFEAAAVKIEDVSTDDSKQTAIPSVDENKSSPFSVISDVQTSIKNKTHCKNDVKVIGPLNNSIRASKQNKTKYVNTSIRKVTTNKEQNRPSPGIAKTSNNKQIIEELPRELIDRIRESGRRKGKGIAIIDPVPTSGGKKKKVQDSCTPRTTSDVSERAKLHTNLLNICLDHSYCSTSTPPKKIIKKDPVYVSTEEEPKPLQSQPAIKNADGKMMISLLKVNTLASTLEENKKKKLNIEEYKKRRFGSQNTQTSSVLNCPIESNLSFSQTTEDENTRRMKHEEKLRKMALELLNTPSKSSTNVSPEPSNPIPVKVETDPPSRQDMDVITYVSIGVNTDITGRDPLAPAEKLEEIKPLLESANVKINSNSLITSLIENIPKVIKPKGNIELNEVKDGHRENRTILHLPKIRKLPETTQIGVQTSITLIGNNKRRYRRREDSTSSSSSNNSEISSHRRYRSRYSKSSRSSRSSSISSTSSRSSFRSISRSPSPVLKKRKTEYIREVEERRVIYVGKISPKTTKEDLYYRFSKFGPIKSISLHFRDHGYTNLDNYGFVTFKNKEDAYIAFEHGNDNPNDPQYSLSFGGRRLFCKTNYSDLDNMTDDFEYTDSKSLQNSPPDDGKSSFDRLLMEMQHSLKKRRL